MIWKPIRRSEKSHFTIAPVSFAVIATTETHEFELQMCEKCGEVVGTKKHLIWLCEKLGPLAYTNPSLLIAKSNELSAKTEVPPRTSPPDRDVQPGDFMRILCPKCKCDVNLRL